MASFLTVTTPAMREAKLARQQAEEARIRFETEADAYESDRRDTRERAPAVARFRQEQHDTWERKPEVKRAMEEEVANEMISGSPELKKLAEHDLKRAQEEALRRIAEEQARIERELARQRAAIRPGNTPGNDAPGPV